MRKLRMGLLLGLVAAVAVGQDGCSTETTDEPDKPGGGAASKKPRAKIGDPITLKGADTTMKVTVLGVDDPLSGGEFDQPEKGRRFVGVRIRLENVGKKTYDDSPVNGARLVTTTGERGKETILTGGDCSGEFSSQATISTGDNQQGCLPFEVKKRANLRMFQFALDSGFGPETGEWSLR
jgi:hypothetical protein